MDSSIAIQIILSGLLSGGIITAIAAWRKGRIEGKVEGDRGTLDTMEALNERLNADNLLLRTEARELRQEMAILRQEVVALRYRVTELEQALSEAMK